MIAIDKSKIIKNPMPITNTDWQVAFKNNCDDKGWSNKNNNRFYKPDDVKNALYNLYHKKCGYCEKSILDFDKHVEHYRPKSIYFWLSLSWDNLMLSCPQCNIKKNNKFDKYIDGTTLDYDDYKNETLITVQDKIKEYDKIELPQIINPEQETATSLKAHFTFHLFDNKEGKAGEIKPLTTRMEKTIEVCQLNRSKNSKKKGGLVDKRWKILNTLMNSLKEDLNEYDKQDEREFRVRAIVLTFKKFKIETLDPSSEFSAWRYFILNNKVKIIRKIQQNLNN